MFIWEAIKIYKPLQVKKRPGLVCIKPRKLDIQSFSNLSQELWKNPSFGTNLNFSSLMHISPDLY